MSFPRPDTRIAYIIRLVEDDGWPRHLSLSFDPLTPHDEQCTGEVREQDGSMVEESTDPLLIQRAAPTSTDNTVTSSNENQSPFPGDDSSNFKDGNPSSSDQTSTLSGESSASSDDSQPPNVDPPISSDKRPTPSPTPSGQSPKPSAIPSAESSSDKTSPSTCFLGDQVVPVPLQDAYSWQTVGCLPGFLCESGPLSIQG
ncbi:MAG: hypothetical protein L6R39_002168 [Caloplaca ligustica]|nr:MAG: hypothetical protein L6R39_002168 [Caloplaca ligustica]